MTYSDCPDLVRRYLAALEEHLPASQRDDIVAEVKDSIASRMEDSEAALSRPVTLDEQSAILRAYGPPMIAASRYWKQQQLIGPRYLPYYGQTLRIVLWMVLALNVAALCIGLLTEGSPPAAFVRVWGVLLNSALAAIGAVTVIFSLLERFGRARDARDWDPRKLPSVVDGRPVSLCTSAVELVVNGTIVVWLLSLPPVRAIIAVTLLGPSAGTVGNLPLGLAPVWRWGILALLVACLVSAALNVTNLVRPDLSRLRYAVLALANAFLGVVELLIARVQPLIVATPNARHLPYAHALRFANEAVFWALIATSVATLLTAALYARKLERRTTRETFEATAASA